MSKPKLHFIAKIRTRPRETICGRDHAFGCWTDRDRVCWQPEWGARYGPELCKDCKRWLEKNRPDVLEMWSGALKFHDMERIN